MLRDKIAGTGIVPACQTSGKMHLILKIKNLCNSLNTLKVKHLASYLFCSW